MCGIVGKVAHQKINPQLLEKMNALISHRGPDDQGLWFSPDQCTGFGHRRLSIIDLSKNGHQPMSAQDRYTIVFNGEIYNYKLLRSELEDKWNFRSKTDTEVILAAYANYGKDCVKKLRGMFAFAIWDNQTKSVFCARDHFGIKPFYYSFQGQTFSFASEAKALLPSITSFTINKKALYEYLNFQLPLEEQTLIDEIKQLMPGCYLEYKQGQDTVHITKYWDVHYGIDENLNSEKRVSEEFASLFHDSIDLHLNSDVPVGSYLSGGVDSSLVSVLASEHQKDLETVHAFHGKFTEYEGYDESYYAQCAAKMSGQQLNVKDISSDDFLENVRKVIYHLDFPVAGPGAFPQFMVSELASQHVKVILGGQGGDEVFGGYARYMVGYLEQCIKASILDEEDKLEIPFASILPNIKLLKQYIPMIQSVWSKDLFGDFSDRYFRIINRGHDFDAEVNWDYFDNGQAVLQQSYNHIFNAANTEGAGYLNKMLHFDFKTLLPALLQVEDRMSMAHGIESRVPFLDVPIIEFAAKVPPHIKFSNGKMKNILKSTFPSKIPQEILTREDKMGFPVPLQEMFAQDRFKDFLINLFLEGKHQSREYVNYDGVIASLQGKQGRFSRKMWGLLSLELWHQEFQDKFHEYQKL